MIAHATRTHARLSASGAHRWMACPPSARLEEQFPDTTSEAAREGTLAHELAELKLRNYVEGNPTKRKLTSEINKLKKHELWQDEMQNYTDEYVQHIKELALSFKSAPIIHIEKKVSLEEYIPEGFGTADCVLIHGDELHVIDFKYGKGVPVSATDNPQLRLYALGVYSAYRVLYNIKTIHTTIIQPRLDNIYTETLPVERLLVFGEEVKARAKLAAEGAGEFNPGEHCRFCRARAQCRARAEESVSQAFAVGQLPPLITAEEAGEYLLKGEQVAKWLSDLQDWALSACLAGENVPGWKAVEGRGSRDWTDMDAAFGRLKDDGIDEAVLYERRPLTLAQVEKVVGKSSFAETVGEFVIKKPGKPALVKESDKRPAITNKVSAATVFGEEEAAC